MTASNTKKASIDDLIDDEKQYTDEGNSTFCLTVIHNKRGTLKGITKHHTVKQVITAIKTEIFNDGSKNIDVIAGGKVLAADRTMSFYGFPKASARANRVSVVFRANGGK